MGTFVEMVNVGNCGVSVAVSDLAQVMAHTGCAMNVLPKFEFEESSSSSSILGTNFPHRLLTSDVGKYEV